MQEETRLNTVWYSLIRNDYYDCAKNLKKGDLSRFTPSRSENTIRKIKWIYDCDSLLIYRSDSNQTKSSDYWKTTTSIANSWYNYWKYKNIIFPNVIKKWGISTTDGQTLYPFVDTIMYNYKIQNDWVIGSFRQMDRVVPDCVAFHFPDFGGSYEINYLDHNIRIIYDSNKIINSIVFHWGDYSSSKQSSYSIIPSYNLGKIQSIERQETRLDREKLPNRAKFNLSYKNGLLSKILIENSIPNYINFYQSRCYDVQVLNYVSNYQYD